MIPDIVSEIRESIDEDDENQSQRIISAYDAANGYERRVMDDLLICICGWGMKSLIKHAEKHGRFVE